MQERKSFHIRYHPDPKQNEQTWEYLDATTLWDLPKIQKAVKRAIPQQHCRSVITGDGSNTYMHVSISIPDPLRPSSSTNHTPGSVHNTAPVCLGTLRRAAASVNNRRRL